MGKTLVLDAPLAPREDPPYEDMPLLVWIALVRDPAEAARRCGVTQARAVEVADKYREWLQDVRVEAYANVRNDVYATYKLLQYFDRQILSAILEIKDPPTMLKEARASGNLLENVGRALREMGNEIRLMADRPQAQDAKASNDPADIEADKAYLRQLIKEVQTELKKEEQPPA